MQNDAAKQSETKIDRRKRKSRAAIRTAFEELLKEKSPSKITVTELAKRADIDRKTFYLHYESIDSLMDEMVYEELSSIAEALADVPLGRNGETDVQLLFEVLSERLFPGLPEYANLLHYASTDQLITRVQPILTRVTMENDSLGLTDTLGPYLEPFVAFYCSGLIGLYRQWIVTDSELPMENLTALTSAALTGGIAFLSKKAESMRQEDAL